MSPSRSPWVAPAGVLRPAADDAPDGRARGLLGAGGLTIGRPGPWLVAVLVAGAVIRGVLVPITHGPDFTVWDLASQYTLRGVNVYAHHPPYSGGPFAYFPLFLYVELPMQWLAQHLHVSFTILGKLPIVASDLAVAVLLAATLRRAGMGDGRQALAAGLFFLNPLVLYNGAYYGRFDSFCVALLLLALLLDEPDRAATWRFSLTYALAVAAKTFPLFILPVLIRRDRVSAVRILGACIVVLGVLSAPYLGSLHAFGTDLLYSADKVSGGLSWQVVLHGGPSVGVQVLLSQVLLGIFAVAMLAFGRVDDMLRVAAIAILLFLALSKVVLEQYLTWPMPFLIVLALRGRSRAATLAMVVLTTVGMIVNADVHPFGREPVVINTVLAACMLAVAAHLERNSSGGRSWRL
jgi:hypothetical protein